MKLLTVQSSLMPLLLVLGPFTLVHVVSGEYEIPEK
jgi:hypothetical protein